MSGSKGMWYRGLWKARTGKKGAETIMTLSWISVKSAVCSVDELRDD